MSQKMSAAKQIAFIIVMSALANILGYFSIPIGTTKIHFMQLPIILSGLLLGPFAGGMVGFIGATVMAFTLPTPNLFVLPGNAILGFFTGFFYLRLKRIRPLIVPQLLSVLCAIAIHFPYVYISDVYLMTMPSSFVLSVILPKLFLEDVIGLFGAHAISFRINIAGLLGR